MMKYIVSITRVETFEIETDCADAAVDIAFDESGSIEATPYAYTVDGVSYGTVLSVDQETIDHTVEEQEEREAV